MTVLIYVNTSKQVGDPSLKVFATTDAAEAWFMLNPEGDAFECEVMGLPGQRLNSARASKGKPRQREPAGRLSAL